MTARAGPPAPLPEADATTAMLLHRRGSAARWIYRSSCVAVLAGGALLPVVRVPVTVASPGAVRPLVERHEVRARAGGVLERVLVERNDTVQAGAPIAELRAGVVDSRAAAIDAQLGERRALLADVARLVRLAPADPAPALALGTARFRQEHQQRQQELGELALRRERALRDLRRAEALRARDLLSVEQLEEKQFLVSQLDAEVGVLHERHRRSWETARLELQREIEGLVLQASALSEERQSLVVVAPVTGTVEELAGVSPGSYVQAGERLAVLSPSTAMLVEAYVEPRDIGLLRVGMPARLQVDAFNYLDWGTLPARVTELPGDVVFVGDRPVFRAVCAVERSHLELRSGVRGELRKGMTGTVRFEVAQRSLLQLLRDDVSDWLDPRRPGARAEAS